MTFYYPMPTSEFVCVQVQYREEYKSFTHFITSVCAIVGGVFTVSGLIDSFIYHGQKVGFARQAYGVVLVDVLHLQADLFVQGRKKKSIALPATQMYCSHALSFVVTHLQ